MLLCGNGVFAVCGQRPLRRVCHTPVFHELLSTITDKICNLTGKIGGVLPNLSFESAFPNNGNFPAITQKHGYIVFVTLHIGTNFFGPELRSCSWQTEQRAVFMAMPKASVDEYHRAILCEDHIGLSGKLPVMQPEPEAGTVQHFPDGYFRLGIFPPYAGHHPAAGRLINYVGQSASFPQVRF
jgi:hypothetical protein